MAEPKPRILFCPAWFPNRFNEASGQFNLTLARELSKFFEIKVLYVHVHEDRAVGTSMDMANEGDLTVLRYHVYRRFRVGPLFPMLYVKRFKQAFRKLYAGTCLPELVFVRGILPGGLGAQTLQRRFQIPYVTIESFSGFDESMKSRPKRLWVENILNAARRNAAVSSYQRDEMNRSLPGIDFQVQTNVIAETPPVGADPGDAAKLLKMIYVGNIVPVKGWDLLLEGLRIYRDSNPSPIQLTIVGTGEDESLRETIDRLNLTEVVDFIGWQPREKIPGLISRHHFLVLPSRIDTSPNVVLESMMEGRPVLATRSGGAQDMISPSAGHLVDKESPLALAEGIAWMASHLNTFDASTIRGHVIERHSIQSLVGFLMDAIEQDPAVETRDAM